MKDEVIGDEAKIPPGSFDLCRKPACDKHPYCEHDLASAARWMREKCAKFAETYNLGDPFSIAHSVGVSMASHIRRIGYE